MSRQSGHAARSEARTGTCQPRPHHHCDQEQAPRPFRGLTKTIEYSSKHNCNDINLMRLKYRVPRLNTIEMRIRLQQNVINYYCNSASVVS